MRTIDETTPAISIDDIDRRQNEVLQELDQLIARLDDVLRVYADNPAVCQTKAA